jgi:hypothetical protein
MKLNENTMVSLGLIGTIILTVAAGAGWASSISHRLGDIEEHLKATVGDRWTEADMRAWVRAVNREIEAWGRSTEASLNMPQGTWYPLQFPEPDETKGNL